MSETIKLLDGTYGGSEIVINGLDSKYVGLGYIVLPDDMPNSPRSGRLYKVTHPKSAYRPWGAMQTGWKFDRNLR